MHRCVVGVVLAFAFILSGSSRRVSAQCATQWLPMGTGMDGPVRALTTLPNGDLVAAGSFETAGGAAANNIARWNGTSWSAIGTGWDRGLRALTTLPNGDLVAGGIFGVARWDGTSWSALGTGVAFPVVYSLTTLPNGDLVAGGDFWNAYGAAVNNIARWSGSSWSALGTGMNDEVVALTTLPNGDLVAGGRFTTAGGAPASKIARWNGTSWSAMGTGMGGTLYPGVLALTTLPNGDLVAGGDFTMAGGAAAGNIARWDGTSWSALGTGMNSQVYSLTTLPNGDLVAGGGFTTAGGAPANRVARWDGTSWSAMGAGVNNFVAALTLLPNGDLVAGGEFTTAGGAPASRIARLATTCPAAATGIGAGCAGPAGPLTLVAATMPWAGTTLQLTGTNLPVPSFVLALSGLTQVTPGLPLLSVFPTALPGCELLATPDLVDLIVATVPPGTATWSLPLPNTPSIAGFTFYHQMVAAEFDPSLHFLSVTSTNALQLTVGFI